MMKPAARIIRQLLLDAGVVATSGDWTAFVSSMPDQPYSSVCVYDTSGPVDGRVMGGTKIEHDGFQVLVRGPEYASLWEKVKDIADALDAVAPGTEVEVETGSAYILQNVSRRGAVMPLGTIEQGTKTLQLFAVNGIITVREE